MDLGERKQKESVKGMKMEMEKMLIIQRKVKGTVSQELRWVLLYINLKLFSRAIVGHHKI